MLVSISYKAKQNSFHQITRSRIAIKMPKPSKSSQELPNILVTGTPGAGKSHLCEKLVEKLKFEWQDISKIAKDNDCVESFDEVFECPILDEDKLLDHMEPIMAKGGNIVEYHGCDFFPERWFQAVFVVTCSNTILYDRLKEREYNEKKIQSNVECEIFQTILDEAKDSYENDIIHVLKGETAKDLEESLKTVLDWHRSWKRK